MDDLFTKKSKEESYYKLLNCVPTSNKDQITAEYRVLAKQYHPDKKKDTSDEDAENEKNKSSSDMYLKITKAYKVLSDDLLRKDYDKWMNSGLCVTYEKWTELSKATHTSLHWGCMKNEQLALTKDDKNEKDKLSGSSSSKNADSACENSTTNNSSAMNPSMVSTLANSSSNSGMKRPTGGFNIGSRRSKFRKYEI